MGRIADLASGWTVEGDAAPAAAPRREASGPVRSPRRASVTQPPPPPGSAERQALEDRIAALTAGPDIADDTDDDDDSFDSLREPRPHGSTPRIEPAESLVRGGAPRASGSTPPAARLQQRTPLPLPRSRHATGDAPISSVDDRVRAKRPAREDGAPIDLSMAPEADRTTENRGAVGTRHDNSGSHTANSASGTIGGDTPIPGLGRPAVVTVRAASSYATGGVPVATPDSARFAVPLGEFDHGEMIEQDKLRAAYSHATLPRDAAGIEPAAAPKPAAVAPKPPAAPPRPLAAAPKPPAAAAPKPPAAAGPKPPLPSGPVLRGDPRFNDASTSSTARFERADPTMGQILGQLSAAERDEGDEGDEVAERAADRNDATMLSVPSTSAAQVGGILRNPAALPRRPGLWGDLRYPATVMFGLRRARRELAAIELRQVTRQQSRRHHLVTLGRTALTGSLDGGPGSRAEHPALVESREQLLKIEDERSRHAGEVFAADAELTRVRGERETQTKQRAVDLAAIDAELAALATQLAPLENAARRIKKRAGQLHEALGRVDAKIAAIEASRAPSGHKVDPVAAEAEIAMLRAERKAVQGDEPVIAGELDALSPRIAALEATRTDAHRRRAELTAAAHEDQLRVDELLAAIGAQRKVVDRATAAAEARRDKLLFQLGEQLCVDRPDDLVGQLAPIDEIDVELGSADRRLMELREVLGSVDQLKVARGIALLAVIVGGLGTLAVWLLVRFGYLG